MTKGTLIELLGTYSDDAIIYIEADHGQVPEQAVSIAVSKDEELPGRSEDIAWKDASEVKRNLHVTAIKIS